MSEALPPPLRGVLVADFSRILAGPLASQMLADDGARVIKVEEAEQGDETRRWGPPFAGHDAAYFLALNRGKESIALNLKSEEGREIAQRLIARADVVLHNFRDEQAHAFGLDAESVRAMNSRAVHCAIRGFERGTAEDSLPGFDLLAQAAGGLMAITGEPGGSPMKVGVALSDVLTAHWARAAIVTALLERERSGTARSVEISLVGATIASLANVAQAFLVTQVEPARWGNAHPSIVPYQLFEARDRSLVIAAGTDRQWRALAQQVLRNDRLTDDPRFTSNALRVENRSTLIPLIDEIIRTRDAAEWIARCRSAGVPAAMVSRFGEIFDGSAATQLVELEHPEVGALNVVGSPLRWNGVRYTAQSAPPALGAHSVQLLHELGLSDEAIEKAASSGAVR